MDTEKESTNTDEVLSDLFSKINAARQTTFNVEDWVEDDESYDQDTGSHGTAQTGETPSTSIQSVEVEEKPVVRSSSSNMSTMGIPSVKTISLPPVVATAHKLPGASHARTGHWKNPKKKNLEDVNLTDIRLLLEGLHTKVNNMTSTLGSIKTDVEMLKKSTARFTTQPAQSSFTISSLNDY